jgi:hypothetical protein
MGCGYLLEIAPVYAKLGLAMSFDMIDMYWRCIAIG